MASEQKVSRKKKSESAIKEHQRPVLYRHQDCIPTPNLFHGCERNNFLNVKLSNEEIVCANKLVQNEKVSEFKNKPLNLKPKTENKEATKLSANKLDKEQLNGSEHSGEELSKSRRRRLRKQKLLTSLAPTVSNTSVKSKLTVENSPTSNPVPQSSARPSSTAIPAVSKLPTSAVGRSSETGKHSLKDSRKRIDKSVGSRNKTIKGKTLSESVSVTKADIIKSLEEKTLSSLLQTLVPLTNSSPKKEKPLTPSFSFNDKKLNPGDSKVNKDEVFYFGETKHQLEKLTSSFKINSEINQEKPESSGQNPEIRLPNKFSVDKLNNLETSVSQFNFPSVVRDRNLPEVKPNVSNFVAPQACNLDSKKVFNFGTRINQSQNVALKAQKPKVSFDKLVLSPIEALVYNRNACEFPATLRTKSSSEFESKSVVSSQISLENPNSTEESKVKDKLKNLLKNNISSLSETTNNMDLTTEKSKSNKSREEIKLEREAKKAAKLAAKSKHKTAQCTKDSAPKTQEKQDSESKKQETGLENKSMSAKSEPVLVEKPTIQSEQVNEVIASSDEQKPMALSTGNLKQADETILPQNDVAKDASAKSKAELRAERRAKQESQRAAKALSKTMPTMQNVKPPVRNELKTDINPIQIEKKQEVTKTSIQPKLKLFSHLRQEKSPLSSIQILKTGDLHRAIVRLGVQYATKVVVGSNARCVALLNALKQMVNDYTTPLDKDFSRGLEEELGPVTTYLNQCRPLAVSMNNALRHIKWTLTQLPNNVPDVEARQKICDVIDTYIHEQIDVAGEAICNTVKEKIADGDVILTYGCSSLVYKILVQSHLSGKRFRVVIVDGLPWREGREMLRRLVDKGLSCTYVLITAASFIMREANKVLLGAHALLANGYVMARAGSSQVALLAHCYNVPVLVCCETHKFCERVQTDAFVYNELGELHSESSTKDKEKNQIQTNLTALSLAYDITPPDLVSAVVTELAVLPCTSVPVILRIKPSESVM